MNFQREKAHDVFQEMMPLFFKHYKEIAHYDDIELDPDFDTYLKMEELGILRVFTARTDEGLLIGYCVYFIKHNLHYKKSLQALQDVLFVDPEHRGVGGKFILWCDRQLQKEKIQVAYHHIKVKTPHTVALIKRLGYEEVDIILAKRLDK